MGEDIEIRQASTDDWPAISDFIVESYGETAVYKGWARWEWQFCNNPYLTRCEQEHKVPVWIAVDNGRVVGQIAVQLGELHLDGRQYRAGWIVDVMVLPDYRGRGLGHRIHAKCAESEHLLVTLTMAPATRRISEKAGCINLESVKQFTRLQNLENGDIFNYIMHRTRSRPRLHRVAWLIMRFGGAHRIALGLTRVYLAARDAWLASRKQDCTVLVEEFTEFGEEIEELWHRAKTDYHAIFARNLTFLKWRFERAPFLTYRMFLARRDGRVVGYMVLRRALEGEQRLGTIVDLFTVRRDKEAIEELVRFSLSHFGASVAGIDCVTSIPEIECVLRRHGFIATRTVNPTCVCQDRNLEAQIGGVEWLFTKADHDWDQVHLARDFSSNGVAT